MPNGELRSRTTRATPNKLTNLFLLPTSTPLPLDKRQLDGVELDKTFTDKASGKDVHRPQLQAALEYLREGDVLVVHSMDRLARNLVDLRKLVDSITQRGVQVHFEKENLTFTGDDSPMSNLLLSMLGAVAQFEREIIKERQREGIAIAKKTGVYKGRKPSLTSDRVAELKARIARGEKKAALAREFGISRETLYQYAPVTAS
jgi:DNA invertase Pin-like site-specific DNA recombinase